MKASVLAMCAASAVWLFPAIGAAQGAPEEPEVRAKKACAAGRVDEGVEILAELFARTGDFNYVYNQGRCYQQNGVADKAINRFREYLRRVTDLPPADRAEVEGFIAQLEKQRPAVEETSPEESRRRRLRIVGLSLGALGAVAIGTGAVLGLQVSSYESETNKESAKMESIPLKWWNERDRRGNQLATFQWVAYGVGAAALAGGVACYLLGQGGGPERTVAWSWAPDPVGRGFATSMTVRY